MGILRADRVSGLGGANAINGSVFFPYKTSGGYFHSHMEIMSDDFAVGTGDFTSECFFYQDGLGGHTDGGGNILVLTGNKSGTNGIWISYRNDGKFQANVHYSGGSWNLQMTSSNAFNTNQWYHVALVRSGSAVKLYIDGVQEASGTSSSALIESVSNGAWIGSQGNTTNDSSLGSRGINGYISNVRISNEALYTAAFTAPTTRLEKLSSTLLLCCQSSGNILKEETGKNITLYRKATEDSAIPKAKRFSPDLGEEHGTTFADNTKFDTLSYMVPPGGKTTDRYLKSTGDIVSGNLIWHIDAGNVGSYAGVTTSGTTIYDLQGGSGMNGGVGIATLTSGHATWPAPGWTPDNGGAWYLGSDSTTSSNYTGQHITMPYINLGNDNYTINVWVKLKYYSENSDGFSYIISNKDGSPVSYATHVKRIGSKGRISAAAYYGGWNYDYAKDILDNTVIELNKWYMLTWVNTAQYTQSMYVNGVIQKLHNANANTWNSRTSNNTPVNATSYAGNETTNAWIGQIQYYSDTLTAAEILQNYNAHKCRYDR